ncbi:MAG: hypothetical protein ACF8LL_04430 [Phycisphaerales bacterium]
MLSNRLIPAAIAIANAGIAHAEPIMSLQVDDRIAVGYGSQESLSGSFDFDSIQSEPMTPFENWTGSAGAGVSAGGGFGEMSSLISSTSILADGSANASATFDALEHNFVTALGSSSHTIGFSIDQTITFSLIANIQATGEANAWVRVREGFGFGDILFDRTVSNDSATINQKITLGPGDYAVQFFANSSITFFEPGSAAGSSSFDAAWTVVPAPATTALLALTLIPRRQRQTH